jgi:cobalt-zinc-cadmium efflux system outer membrane protein
MRTRDAAAMFLLLAMTLAPLATCVTAATAQTPAAAPLRLEELERMALEQNPTIPQARASVRAAEGRELQAGLYPNPLVGYEAEEINTREPGRFKNFFWFQVPIVTAGKLQRGRELAATNRQQAETTVDMQRLRVLTTVRTLYYEALGAARIVELRGEMAKLVREAVSVSEELYNVGQADQPDVLDIEMQSQRADLELAKAESHRRRLWRILAASIGNPSLPLTALDGDLEGTVPAHERDRVMARVLEQSPDVRLARVNVERARAALGRVRAERIPNLFVRTKLGYNAESFSPGKDVGFEAGVEVGVSLPLFDRQQGNLQSAEADVEHAQAEVRRLDLVLRTQVETALKSYDDARVEVERYRLQILPRAERSVELYRRGFQQMAAAYPQVLIAQRHLFQSRVEYVQALVDLWRGAVLFEGFLLAGGLDAPSHTTVQPPPPTGHIPPSSGRAAD